MLLRQIILRVITPNRIVRPFMLDCSTHPFTPKYCVRFPHQFIVYNLFSNLHVSDSLTSTSSIDDNKDSP